MFCLRNDLPSVTEDAAAEIVSVAALTFTLDIHLEKSESEWLEF